MTSDAFQAAVQLHRAGEIARAIERYQAVLHQNPAHAGAHHLLGVAFQQQGRFAQAADQISQALQLDDSKAVYHNNYAVSLRSLGRLDQAHATAQTAIRLNPAYADAHSNLGLILWDLGQHQPATRYFQQALKLRPGHSDALRHLANLLTERGRGHEAVALYEQAIHAQPERAELYNGLGSALLAEKRASDAVPRFQQAVRLNPSDAQAHRNLGSAYAQIEQIDDAARAFRTAGRLRPDKPLWRMRAVSLCPTIFQSEDELNRYRQRLERRLDACLNTPLHVTPDELVADGFVPPFSLAHHGRNNRRLMEKFAALFEPHVPKHDPRPSGGKPRIGFLVTRPHAGGFLRAMGGIVQHMNGNRFQPIVFCPPEAILPGRQRISRHDVEWIGLPTGFSQAAEAILAARCDLLYFRKATADPLAYALAMARLAPVVCTSWGTHQTSGIKELDYYLSSALIEIEDADAHYSERLVRLATPTSYESRPQPVAPATRESFGLPTRGGLYLAPQRLAKFHPAQDELFRNVLDRDSEGHLVLLDGGNRGALEQLLARFARTLGAAARRVLVLPKQKPDDLRRLLSIGDALLDQRHYSASLMAYDAIAAGLPIVTLPGPFKVQRYTLAFYRQMGIQGAVASSAEQYVEIAVRLGTDRDFRRRLGAELADHRDLLFENASVVREHERFFCESLRGGGT